MEEGAVALLLYWLPYNNNLTLHGDPIIKQLKEGFTKVLENPKKVALLLQLQSKEDTKRLVMTSNKIEEHEVSPVYYNQSHNPESLLDFFSFAQKCFPNVAAWYFFVLGHGGALNAFCPNEITSRGELWMDIGKCARNSGRLKFFSSAIKQFQLCHKKEPLELLFLQNCCKGSLEVVYNFRDITKYILCSQHIMGAPNYYYEKMILQLQERGAISGEDLGKIIALNDSPDMFVTYSLVSNLKKLEEKIDPLINCLLTIIKSNNINIEENAFKHRVKYMDDEYIDLLHYFHVVYSHCLAHQSLDPQLEQLYNLFVDYIREEITQYQSSEKPENLCGLNIIYPSSMKKVHEYMLMDIYEQTSLLKFQECLVKDVILKQVTEKITQHNTMATFFQRLAERLKGNT